MGRKNTFSRALKHLQSTQIDEGMPTNNTQGLMTVGDPSRYIPPEEEVVEYMLLIQMYREPLMVV